MSDEDEIIGRKKKKEKSPSYRTIKGSYTNGECSSPRSASPTMKCSLF